MRPQNPTPRPFATAILIVDDSASFRVMMQRAVSALPDVVVIGSVATLDAMRRFMERNHVDVVALDVHLPDGSGIEEIQRLRERHPHVAVLLVTASLGAVRTEVEAIYRGAAGLVHKPEGPHALEDLLRELKRALAGVRPSREKLNTSRLPSTFTRRIATPLPELGPRARELIAIGASTGGPPALGHLLEKLPANLGCPVLVTQHMSASQLPHFASMLSDRSGKRCTLPRQGEPLYPNRVYIASSTHLGVQRRGAALCAEFLEGPAEHGCRPAVDPMFRAAASVLGAGTLGVVLSGMGHDGALGAAALRAVGAPVVVQDEASSVVWGMPGAVVSAGNADVVAPLEQLHEWIEWFAGLRAERPASKTKEIA